MARDLACYPTFTLKVERDGRSWWVRGLSSHGRPDTLLLRRVGFPETEWPEVDSALESRPAMLEALYDLWQCSDDLLKLNRAHDVAFDTPYGKFYGFSTSVLDEDDLTRLRGEVQDFDREARETLTKAQALCLDPAILASLVVDCHDDGLRMGDRSVFNLIYRLESKLELLGWLVPKLGKLRIAEYASWLSTLPEHAREKIKSYGFGRV